MRHPMIITGCALAAAGLILSFAAYSETGAAILASPETRPDNAAFPKAGLFQIPPRGRIPEPIDPTYGMRHPLLLGKEDPLRVDYPLLVEEPYSLGAEDQSMTAPGGDLLPAVCEPSVQLGDVFESLRCGELVDHAQSERALIFAPHPDKLVNILLTVRLFWGVDGGGETEDRHPSLEDSLAALRETFPGQDFRYADAVVARVRADEGFQADGLLAVAGADNPLPYSLGAGALAVSGHPDMGPRTIHLDNLRFAATYPVHQAQRTEVKEAGVQIDVDAPEGQATVIGKTGLGGGYGALYLVLTTEVLD